MDIWRIPSAGGAAERLTNHHSRVAYPAFLDERTLLYTAPRPDGSGSGLYAMDIERRIPHAVSFGLEEYVSVAASADGRRLVATVANPTSHLWTVPITDHVVDESRREPLFSSRRARGGSAIRARLRSLSVVQGGRRRALEVQGRLGRPSCGREPRAPSPPRRRSRPTAPGSASWSGTGEQARLYVMAADGTDARRIAESLDVRDAPSWSPDGKWIAVVATEGNEQPLFKVPVDGGAPVRLVGGVNSDPVWSPDGRFIVYSEQSSGTEVPAEGDHSGEAAVPAAGGHGPAGGNRYRFLPDGKALVLMQGGLRQQDFWLLDLATGQQRQLTNLRPGFDIKELRRLARRQADPLRPLSRELRHRPDRSAAALNTPEILSAEAQSKVTKQEDQMAGKVRRTTHRSSTGKKLYAVRDAKGRFKDIQTYERAHRADLAHKSKAEKAKK